jgi:hypothetical protein
MLRAAQSGWWGVADAAPIERREPLKAADGVADAAPVSVGHLKVAD